MYNYYEAMKEDVLNAIHDYFTDEELSVLDREEIEEKLNDELWIDDSVTGNGSGSYTFNSYKAKEYVTDNDELCREALQEFCVDSDTVADHFLSGDWEYFDVTIRCYLLAQVLDEVLDEIEAETEAA